MHNASYEIFSSVASSFGNTRWGQVIDFSSLFGVVEIFSFGNAQEEGVAEVTRVHRLLSGARVLPKVSFLKKKINNSIVESFLMCIIQEKSCELCVIGKGKVFLRRGRMLSPLLVKEGIIKGSLKKGDCLIFLSKTAAELFDSEERELFSPILTPKEISETMSVLFSQKGKRAEGAVCLVVDVVGVQAKDESKFLPKSLHGFPMHRRARSIFSFFHETIKKPKLVRHTIVITIAGFFCFSVFLGIRKQQTDNVSNQRRQAVEQAQNLLREGIALTDIQPLKSREYLEKALGLLSPYVGESLPKGKEGRTIQQLEKQLQDNLRIISRIYTPDVQIFYDASFLQKDRVVSLFTVGENELAFADTNVGMVAVVSLLSKEARVVAGGNEYTATQFLSFAGQNLYIVTKDSVDVIVPGGKTPKRVMNVEDLWDAFATYGGNLYAISRDQGKIWRYPGKDNAFGNKEDYLAKDIYPNLTKTRGLSIDGSVWLGSSIGKVFRYTQGRDDPFLIRGVDPPLGQQLDVFVSEKSPFVYILDQEGKRIVLVSKQGMYHSQYLYGDVIQPSSFGVSLARKRVYLLADQKIYSLSIEE